MTNSFELNKAARRILAKNWLDVAKVKIQVAGKTMIVRGCLIRLRDDEPVNGLFIEHLEQQLKNTQAGVQVRWMLDDWKIDRGQWMKAED